MVDKSQKFNRPNYYNNNDNKNISNKTSKSFEQVVKQETIEKLNNLIQKLALKLKKENINVTNDCRIDMDSFESIYSDIKNDKRYIETIRGKMSNTDYIGEPVEILTTIVWNKVLGDRLIVVRTSMFDDIKNGVDNLIVEKKTGKTICAIDDVSSLSTTFVNKTEKIFHQNNAINVKNIKYGLTIKDGQTLLTHLERVPVFCIGIPLSGVDQFANYISDSIDSKPSLEEQKLMEYYYRLLEMQIRQYDLSIVAADLEKLIPDTIKKELKYYKTQNTR